MIVYVIVAVPTVIPVTKPEVLTVATALLLVVQTPPEVADNN